MVLPLQPHADVLAPEHAEGLFGKVGHIDLLGQRLRAPPRFQDPHAAHLVHAVVLHFPRFLVVGDQVVILIVPDQVQRTYFIYGAVVAELQLLPDRPVHILVGDLPVLVDRGVDHVHVVVDRLVGGLRPPVDGHLVAQLLRLVAAAQGLQLADELPRFFLCDEFGRLDRIHEELKLRQFKLPRGDVPALSSPLTEHDVQAAVLQLFDLRIDRRPVDRHIVFLQEDLLEGGRVERVFLIRPGEQDLHQIEGPKPRLSDYHCHPVTSPG